MPDILKTLWQRVRRIRLRPSSKQSEGTQGTARTTHAAIAEGAAESSPIRQDETDVDVLTEDDCYGIKVLHNPPSAFVDLVFVHGLRGKAHRTWFDKESGVHWPRDLLGPDLDARIMTFGYDANIVNAAQDDISGYAKDLLGDLSRHREDLRAERKIIFVAHSLGGLVTKKALALSGESRFPHLRAIEIHTTGIVFLGTPHHGADLAKWGSFLSNIANLAKPVNKDVIKALRRQSETLAGVQDAFHNLVERRKDEGSKVRLICFYETMPVYNTIIVSKDSAVIPGEPHFPIRKNHKDMAKYQKKDDKGYQDILREIRMIAENFAFQHFWDGLGQENISEHLRQTPTPLEGTFKWIHERLRLDEISTENQPRRLLRITGQPGCGKSVLAASLYRRGFSNEQRPITTPIFYAFNGRDANRRSPSAIFPSLIKQLFRSKKDRLHLQQYFNQARNEGDLPADFSSHTFRWACTLPTFGHLICIIDALDECDNGAERDKLVADLESLVSGDEKINITLVLLNRDYWELNFAHVDLPAHLITHINLDKNPETQEDIMAFTVEGVELLLKKRPTYNPYKARLIDKIFERASDGMFLMVLLVIDLLYRCTDSSPRGIDHTIQTLPSTLQEVYSRIWDSIDPLRKPRAEEIMGWMVATFQPIAVQTLADALAHEALLDSDDDSLTLDDFRSSDLRGDLKRLFGPLLWIDDTVHLTHQTVKEFFLLNKTSLPHVSASPSILPGDRHIKIAITCLFCLTRNRDPDFGDTSSIDTMFGFNTPPFYAYAKSYCLKHFVAATQSGEDANAIQEFRKMCLISKVLIGEPTYSHPGSATAIKRALQPDSPTFDDIASGVFMGVGPMELDPMGLLSEDSYHLWRPRRNARPRGTALEVPSYSSPWITSHPSLSEEDFGIGGFQVTVSPPPG
ncbi:hypothetical protein BCR34DRAFT_585166 [Clohesyomyces aquaticus]|uniref:Uncharacterized protein n=1 Tax=Clohesyomyces aquaticus TaxID=1231657 RepID=A0A1Y1ZYY9_9PLEO|nr:hypothetical protein BCR34DRAFT_585166 [Clohesyomyces aquaticus]